MKKHLLLFLLFTGFLQAQTYPVNPTKFGKISLNTNITDITAVKVNVQSSDNTINTIPKSDLIEVLEYASAINLPVTGVSGKIYVTIDSKLMYRWNGIVYEEYFPSKENIVNKSDSYTTSSTTTYPNTKALVDGLALQIPLTQKGAINGVATLGADGKVHNSQIPALAISETFPVASQAEMLALSSAEQGDVAIRSDISKSYILRVSPSSVLSNWSELLSPTFTGTDSGITKTMVGLGNVDNTSDLNKPISTATQTALNLKENVANKQNSLAVDGTGTKYPTVDAVKNEINTLKDYTREISVGAGGTYSTLELLFANEPAGKTLINLTDSQYTCLNPQFLVKTGWIIKGKGYGKTNLTFNFTTVIDPYLSGLQIRNDCELIDFKVTSINDTNLGGFSQYALHADYAGAFKAKITRCWFKTIANPNQVDANGYNGLAVGIGTWEGQVLEFHESILQGQSVSIDNKYTLNLHNTFVSTVHSTPSRVSFYNCQLSGGFTTVLISDTYSNSTESDSVRIKDLFEFVGCEIKGGIYLRTANQLGGTNRKNGLSFNFSGTNVDEFINVGEIVNTSLPNYDVTSLPLTKDVDFQKNVGINAISEGDFVSYVYANRIPEYHRINVINTPIGIEKLNTTNIKNFAGMSLTNTAVGDFAHINTGVISYTALEYPTINIGDLVAFNSDNASLVKSSLNGIGKVYKKTNTGRLGIFISKGGKTENSIGTYTDRGVLEIKGNSGGKGHPSIWLEDSNIVGESTNYAISAAANSHNAPFYEKGRFSIADNIAGEERFAIDHRGLNIIRRKLSVLDVDNVGDNLEYTKLPTINVKGNNRPIGTGTLDFGNIQVNSREPQAEDTGGSIGLGGVYNSAGGIVSFAKIHGKKETSVTGSFDGYLAFEVSNNTTLPYTREVGRFSSNGSLSVLGTITASPAVLPNQVVIKSQLDAKADLASPTLTGTPTAPTAAPGTNTTQIATTAFVAGGLATKENTFSKNTAFNKNFGTTAGTVVEGGTLGSNAYTSTVIPTNTNQLINGAGFITDISGKFDNTGGTISGNVNVTGTVTASGGFFNSDLRLKNIIKRDGDVVYYTWKDGRDNKLHAGYIAQEVQENYPNQVQADEKGMLSVNYVEILVEKIRLLEKRIDQLEKSK